jgi:cyclopropane-fatty-acyl-phospholipid synthase
MASATKMRRSVGSASAENLRAHYARTTRAWAERLQAARAPARALVGERAYRTWLAYLAAASTAFEAGWIALHQIVATPAADAAHWTDPVARPLPLDAEPRALADAS